jgi:HAD superfamily hydrolase (TIGR01549 family)
LPTIEWLKYFSVVFWDFDGVIKESVQVKTKAFRELFSEFGKKTQDKVQEHHELNGGVSRFEKIPFYCCEYLGITLSDKELLDWCDRFQQIVVKQVIDSPWVSGVLDYLQRNYQRQNFFIVTGTPQEEIEHIVDKLDLSRYFKNAFGSPDKKSCILNSIIAREQFKSEECLMIGDALTDYSAAKKNNVAFLLRETAEAARWFKNIECERFKDFTSLSRNI